MTYSSACLVCGQRKTMRGLFAKRRAAVWLRFHPCQEDEEA